MLNPIYAYKRRAYYYETDKMGVVHHSNYIKWFEEARVSMLQQAGMPFTEMEKLGVMCPVLSVSLTYVNSVKFNDEFCVIAKITKFTGFRIEVDYEVVSSDKSVVFARGNTSHCFVGADMKPVRTKKNFPEIYNVFHEYTDYEPILE